MVRRGTILLIAVLSILIGYISAPAQTGCFVQTQTDRKMVYVQQPLKITFTVLTTTWYTAPLVFDNLQIPDAFILPFDRTQSGMYTVGGKQYAGLQFYFIVFPYKHGNFTIPAIKITATTPAPGDYKGRPVILESSPQSIIVKPAPASYQEDVWFVANDVSLTAHWNKSLANLKVGDVIERTVEISAKGTLPQFIPEIKPDSMDWASVYPRDPVLTDTRDQYNANGVLTQKVTYLLEKEGDYQMPDAKITWWNPYSGRLYSRDLPKSSIHVAANPNLGILSTMKDSLLATQTTQKATQTVKKGPYMIYGIPWYWALLYVVAGIFVLYIFYRLIMRLVGYLSASYKRYRISEPYWFRKFMRSALFIPDLLKNLYGWWDRYPVSDFPGTEKPASMTLALEMQGEAQLGAGLAENFKKLFREGDITARSDEDFRKGMSSYRKRMKAAKGDREREGGEAGAGVGKDRRVPLRQQGWE